TGYRHTRDRAGRDSAGIRTNAGAGDGSRAGMAIFGRRDGSRVTGNTQSGNGSGASSADGATVAGYRHPGDRTSRDRASVRTNAGTGDGTRTGVTILGCRDGAAIGTAAEV